LSGDAYVEAVTSESGAPFEMHVLRSDRFELRVHKYPSILAQVYLRVYL
jgi:hypothetical protein